MRIYISGPVSDNEKRHFQKAEDYLRRDGDSCINIAKVNEALGDLNYEEIMKINLQILGMCDGIYMLKGWQDSPKANCEYGFAIAKNLWMHAEADELTDTVAAEESSVQEDQEHEETIISFRAAEEEEPDPEEEDNSEEEETGKRKKIDIGKIMALRAAGWTNHQIADEMGMKTGSVAEAICRYRKKQKEAED